MSKIALSPSPTGSAVYTIASPAGSTDRTLNLPDGAGTIATAESTLTQFSASGSAPVFAARAWVNFNGTGTVAIRASGNVSSITDSGTGVYTVNFTTALNDASYSVVMNATLDGNTGSYTSVNSSSQFTTTTLSINTRNQTTALMDSTAVSVSIFR